MLIEFRLRAFNLCLELDVCLKPGDGGSEITLEPLDVRINAEERRGRTEEIEASQ